MTWQITLPIEISCPVTATVGQSRDLTGRLSRQQAPAGRPAPLFIPDRGYPAAQFS
jgi:hypothetical protein